MYLVIEGNIGAGKTTLAKQLASDFGARLVLEEFIDNPYLSKFYEQNGANAYLLEVSFLKARYLQLTELFKYQTDNLIVSDFHFVKSRIFASVNLNEEEFSQYDAQFQEYHPQIREPDMVIFLDKPVHELLINIKQRGRDFESGISQQYLENIEKTYRNFFAGATQSPVLKITANGSYLEPESADYKFIVNAINEKL